MKYFVIVAALIGVCFAEDFVCPRDDDGLCIDNLRFAHSNCSKFYRCFVDDDDCVAQVYECPEGLHFSPTIQECLHPDDAGCEDDFVCPRDDDDACIEDRRFAHSDCSKYYRCKADEDDCVAYTFPCPEGLHFSPTVQDCVHPDDAGCEQPTTAATTVSTTPGPTPPPVEGVTAFSVSRSTNWAGGSNDVSFDKTFTNLGNCFKDDTTFETDRGGVYFFSFSAGVPGDTQVDVEVRPTSSPSSIYRESTTHDSADMMYRSFLAEMGASDSLTYRSNKALRSDSGLQTSFSGFSLTDAFEDVEAFFLSREQSYSTQDRIEMPTEHMDFGNNYNTSGREFIAPRDGVYYFFFGSGQAAGVDNRIALRTWEGDVPESEAELWIHSTSHNGLDMATRGAMLEMYAGQHVWLTLMENNAHSDNDHSQLFFGGFWYNPKNAPQVAFAVHRSRPWQSALPLDPVPFEEAGLEVGGDIYDEESRTVIIPTSGYYYIELTVGTLPERPLNVDIMLNGEPDSENAGEVLVNILVDLETHSHVASAGRSFIAHFNRNDVLRVRAAGQTGIFSDYDKQTSWMGFLLYSD